MTTEDTEAVEDVAETVADLEVEVVQEAAVVSLLLQNFQHQRQTAHRTHIPIEALKIGAPHNSHLAVHTLAEVQGEDLALPEVVGVKDFKVVDVRDFKVTGIMGVKDFKVVEVEDFKVTEVMGIKFFTVIEEVRVQAFKATESVEMKDFKAVAKRVQDFKATGVKVTEDMVAKGFKMTEEMAAKSFKVIGDVAAKGFKAAGRVLTMTAETIMRVPSHLCFPAKIATAVRTEAIQRIIPVPVSLIH